MMLRRFPLLSTLPFLLDPNNNRPGYRSKMPSERKRKYVSASGVLCELRQLQRTYCKTRRWLLVEGVQAHSPSCSEEGIETRRQALRHVPRVTS